MKPRPINFRQVCAFVRLHHRHHAPPQGHKFSLAVEHEGRIVGVAIVGRPVARKWEDGLTVEVTRLCTDGTHNAASKLYGAARRVAGAMGYERVPTYTLDSEPGASLRGAGWRFDGMTAGGKWTRPDRARRDVHPNTPKKRWLAPAQ